MITRRSFELTGRGIHVWTLRIAASNSEVAHFEGVLDLEEKERAARFHFDHLRRSFVITRGVLRCLLGRYVGIHPSAILFQYGLKGKPALPSAANLEFNASHSGDVAAFAFTTGCQIGIDVERIRQVIEAEQIASRFFCPEEAAEVLSLPPGKRERAFFSCWTRKEAYIKATGDGLSVPLDEFRVALLPGEPVRFIHIAHDLEAAKAWTLHDLQLTSDYAAALAYPDRDRPLSIFPIVDPAGILSMP